MQGGWQQGRLPGMAGRFGRHRIRSCLRVWPSFFGWGRWPMSAPFQPVRIGIVGLGNVGTRVARLLDAGAVEGARLSALSSRRPDHAAAISASLTSRPEVLDLDGVCAGSDIIVEATTADAMPAVARTVLGAGRSLVLVSTAGVAKCPDFLDLVARSKGRVRVASGALPGLDLIRSAAVGRIHTARLRSVVLPSSFSGEAALGGASLGAEGGRSRVFSGSAREAAEAFPRHFNVAISLALAGVPLDLLQIELWVDAVLSGPTVEVELEADDVSLSMMSRNLPSPDNPRTSRIVAPSVVAALRGMIAPLQSGS